MLMRMDVARHIFSHTDQKKDGYADQKDLKDGYAANGYAEHGHNNMPDDTLTRNNHHAGAGLVPARSQCGRIDKPQCIAPCGSWTGTRPAPARH